MISKNKTKAKKVPLFLTFFEVKIIINLEFINYEVIL